MQRCLELAANGAGRTSPNPLVGALLVSEGQIIGEGYHRGAGLPHAEVEAIRSVSDPSRLTSSTLYVNLEPCNHTGRTPPCTDLILSQGIPRVVVAQTDPNPLVAGKGLERLRSSGVEVISGVLDRQARELNRRFLTFHTQKRPYLMLKWAQTRDGFVDFQREPGQLANPAWITDEYCRMLVHKWRTEEDAVLVGTRTALLDNPQLNVRVWTGRDPLRLVLDLQGILPTNLSLFDGSQETWVFTHHRRPDRPKVRFFTLDPEEDDLIQVMDLLWQQQILSVMIEGGSELLASFIHCRMWDEARIFTGPGTFGQGVPAPAFPYKPVRREHTGNSLLETFRNHQRI